MFTLTEDEKEQARAYSPGDSSQIIALAILVARWIPLPLGRFVRDLNECLAAVRAERTR